MPPTPVWPSATAPSANNWTDHFSGSALAARWGSLVSGGTITVTDSYADMNCPAANEAAGAYVTTKLDLTKRFTLSIAWAFYNSTGPSDVIYLVSGAWTPAVAAYSTFNPLIRALYGCQDINGTELVHNACYYSTGHAQTAWDGSANAWSTATVNSSKVGGNLQTDDYSVVTFICDGPNSRFRWDAHGLAFGSAGTYTANQGLRQFVSTDWVNFSSLEDVSQGLYLVIGNPVNTNGRANDFRYEWVDYAEAPGNVWYEAWAARKSSVSSGHDIAHYLSADGKRFFLEQRTTNALTRGGSYDAQECQEPCFVWDGASTDHLWYMSSTSGGLQTISHATATHATPQNGPWTKDASNPVLTVGTSGALDDGQLSEPFVINDQTSGTWYLFYSAQHTADSHWRTFYATATSAAGPWTKQGLVLDVGGAGAIDEHWARRVSIVRYGGQWSMFYEAHDASSVDHMGLATASSLAGPWTKTGSSLWDATANGNTTLATPLNTAPGRSWAVASSTGMAQDSVVVISDSTNLDTYGISKVRKVVDATHVETYHGLTGFTTSPQAYVIGTANSPTWNVQQVWQFGGTWVFYAVPWEPFSATAESASAAALYEGCHIATHTAASPTGATPAYQDFFNPVIPHDAWQGMESVENMTLALFPYAGDGFTVSLSAAQATAVTLGKAAGKLLGASQPQTATLTKQPAKLLSQGQPQTATLAKQASKALALAQASAANLTKHTAKLLPLAQATAAGLAALKAHLVSLAVTQATMATMQRATAKALSASQPTSAVLTKATAKLLGVGQATATTLQALKTHLVTLSAVQPTVAGLSRNVGKGLAATQGAAAGIGKATAKGLAATQGTIASLATSGGQQVVGSMQTLYARAQAWVLKVRALVFGQPPSYALSPGPITQSHYETKTRTADFTAALPAGATTVGSPVGYLVRTDTGADVTGASLTVGSPSGATVPFTLTALSPGVQYRLNVTVQAAGNTITGEATVICPD